ncbi:MAG: DUF2273 domain-containing protein [Firmicutes bacterium]|nr:DUF2273 domain-containing protein [Bacillota bacterium]
MDERVLVWLSWLYRHKGTIAGVLFGFVFGWLSIRFGILRALFVLICTVVGVVVGYRIDHNRSWAELFEAIRPSDRFWRR